MPPADICMRLDMQSKAYGDEGYVCGSVLESGVEREEVFITTKVWNGNQGYRPRLAACE